MSCFILAYLYEHPILFHNTSYSVVQLFRFRSSDSTDNLSELRTRVSRVQEKLREVRKLFVFSCFLEHDRDIFSFVVTTQAPD